MDGVKISGSPVFNGIQPKMALSTDFVLFLLYANEDNIFLQSLVGMKKDRILPVFQIKRLCLP